MLNIPGIKGVQQSANSSPLTDAPVESGVTEGGTFLRTLESIHEVAEPAGVTVEATGEQMIPANAESPATTQDGGNKLLETVAVNLSLSAANESMTPPPAVPAPAAEPALPQAVNGPTVVAAVEPEIVPISSGPNATQAVQVEATPLSPQSTRGATDAVQNLASQTADPALASAGSTGADEPQPVPKGELQSAVPQHSAESLPAVEVKTSPQAPPSSVDPVQVYGTEAVTGGDPRLVDKADRRTIPPAEQGLSSDRSETKTPVGHEAEAALRSSFRQRAPEVVVQSAPPPQPLESTTAIEEGIARVTPVPDAEVDGVVDEAERAVAVASNPVAGLQGTDNDRLQRAQSIPLPRPVDANPVEQAPQPPVSNRAEPQQPEPVAQNIKQPASDAGARAAVAQQGELQAARQTTQVPLAPPVDTAVAPMMGERPALADSIGGLLSTTLAGALSPTAAPSAEVAGAHRLVNASVRANINWMIEQGLSRATLQLNPAELGALSIKLETIGDQLNVNIHAAQAATRDVLEQTLPRLREHLSQQGFTEVNVSLGNNQQQSAEYSQGRNGANPVQPNSDTVSDVEPAMTEAGGNDTAKGTHRGMVDLFA